MSPSSRLFGTDGIRARFGEAPLDRETVTRVGTHLASHLAEREPVPSVVLGGDTRASTPTLVAWLAEALAAGGVACREVGVVPTPAVAWLAREWEATAGIAISASHNPHHDNGIKLLGGDGFKWSEDEERRLEDRIAASPTPTSRPRAERRGEAEEAATRYLDHLVLRGGGEGNLAGLRLVVDTANGAASRFAGPLFGRLGARTELLHDRPDGTNINRRCGSTHPAEMAARTRESGAALGIAFDGDADRAILADEEGAVRDGDAILYLWSTRLLSYGRLDPPRIVATSMSNLGLEVALTQAGIETVRCGVGDREVVETMRREGILLGGEQSGHIVHLPSGTTGDGLLTAVSVAHLVAGSDEPLSRRLRPFRRFPQLLRNVPVRSKRPFAELPRITAAAAAVEHRLGSQGRLVLRYSGTEPLARIMIEGPDAPTIEALADDLEGVLQEELA